MWAPEIYDEPRLETAIEFLMARRGEAKTGKPFALHSLRVAALLWQNGASQTVVTAAILHDVLEDTNATEEQIEQLFGADVLALVQATTFDVAESRNFPEKLKAATASFEAARAVGTEALMLRAADLVDNSRYYARAESPELRQYLVEKYETFLRIATPDLKDTFLWRLLLDSHQQFVVTLEPSTSETEEP